MVRHSRYGFILIVSCFFLIACGGGGGGGNSNSDSSSILSTISIASSGLRSDNLALFSQSLDPWNKDNLEKSFSNASLQAKILVADGLDNTIIPSINKGQTKVILKLEVKIPNFSNAMVSPVVLRRQGDGTWKIYQF